MAGGARRSMMDDGSESQRIISPDRRMPKRGQVKGRIVKGLATSIVAMFSFGVPPHQG
ncbi:Transmembrane emp24 domain-containing protein A [Bienertia sinuspersici]